MLIAQAQTGGSGNRVEETLFDRFGVRRVFDLGTGCGLRAET
jgi:hypothetical protein